MAYAEKRFSLNYKTKESNSSCCALFGGCFNKDVSPRGDVKNGVDEV